MSSNQKRPFAKRPISSRHSNEPHSSARHSRLPAITDMPSRGAEIAKGLAAVVGAALIVVGVPIGLLTAFGTPWPSEPPTLEWLTQPTTGEALLAVLAVVVWLAWAHFVVCLVVEAVAERRQRGMAAHVPGGGIGTQHLARRLVATMVLLIGTASATMSTATAATAATAQSGTPTAQAQPAQIQTAQLDTSGLEDAQEPADDALPSVDELDDATGVDQKNLVTYYDVKPPNGRHYDTLWDIAERYLGDGLRYKEIWELNKDIVQPDGHMLRNADLIYPGWVMRMPEDAHGPGLKVVDHVDGAPQTDEAVPASTAGDGEQDSTQVSGATAAPGASDPSDGITSKLGSWTPLFGVAGGLALAGAFLGLRRRRASSTSAQLWARRSLAAQRQFGRGPFDPTDPDDPPPPGGGSRLRDEADTTTAAWLTRAFGQLGAAPAPARASVSGAGLAVVFDNEPECSVPAGWTAATSRLWTVDRHAQLPAVPGNAPLPGVISIGRRDDDSIQLIDLESVGGVVGVDGDEDIARGVALSAAVDTATHPWADRRVVWLVNFADDLSAIGDGAIRHVDNIGSVLESLENSARYQREACRDSGSADFRAARVGANNGAWTYHLVVCSGVPAADDLARLQAFAADQQTAIAAVIVGSAPDAAMKLTARPDGRVVSPLHSIDVTAQILTVDAARELVELYEPTTRARSVSLTQLSDALKAEMSAGFGPASEPVARIAVLGDIEVDAPGPVDDDRRDFLTELACYIAMHPDGVHVNRISAAIWPRGVDADVRDSALAQLVAWFTPAGGTPALAEQSGVWRFLPGTVDFDWDSFRGALNRAADDGASREAHLRTALSLVRSEAFTDAPAGRYAWLESLTVTSDIALAVSLTAQSLAEAAMDRGDASRARAALDRGLELLPANEELWRSMLRLTEHFGDRDEIAAQTQRMYAAIAEHGSRLGASATTDALVDDLLPGYQGQVA